MVLIQRTVFFFFFRLGIRHLILKGKMLPICLKNTPRKQSKEIQGRYALGRVVSNILTAISAWPSHFLEKGCGWCLALCVASRHSSDLGPSCVSLSSPCSLEWTLLGAS